MGKIIDADALIETIRKHSYPMHGEWNESDYAMTVTGIEQVIEEQPEAIVRCKDCRYQNKGSNEMDAWNLCAFMTGTYIPISDDDFCNHGKRRTDI
jgi:hypothetical protein